MRTHPIIDMLRGDPAPQHRAQHRLNAAKEAWSADPLAARVNADLARHAAGAALADCSTLESVLSSSAQAMELADTFMQAFAGELAQELLAHLPFNHASDARNASIILARHGRTTLQVVAHEAGEWPAETAVFSDCERREIVLAGTGTARMFAREDGECLPASDESLSQGAVLAADCYARSIAIARVERRLVSLRLLRLRIPARPSQEVRIADGALVHQASGDPVDSRIEVMASLLARIGHE